MSMKKILVEINGSEENQLDFFKKNFTLHPKISKTPNKKLICSLEVDPSRLIMLDDFCKNNLIDFVSYDELNLDSFKLCLFDMDSTIISIECIDELADLFNKKDDVSKITDLAMRGEINFYQSFNQRLMLLKGLNIELFDDVIQSRMKINNGVERWINFCHNQGIKTVLVSSGFNYFTDHLKSLLNINHSYSNHLDVKNNILTGHVIGGVFGPIEKSGIALKYQNELRVAKHETITIGDGANDLLMMQNSLLSVGYHAKPAVKNKALWNISYGDFETLSNFMGYLI